MAQAVRAVFVNGVLRPVEPLEGVAEHTVVELMLRAIDGSPARASKAFSGEASWRCQNLEDLARAQGVGPIGDLSKLAASFWPDDESVDDLIEFVAEERRRDRESP